MRKQSTGTSIYGYDNFRSYLKHVLEQEKATSSGGSLNGFAKRLELSPSLLKMILAGQRDLSPQAMHKIAFALRLNDRERLYFETMVHRDQANDHNQRQFYQRILDQNQFPEEGASKRTGETKYLAKWYTPAIILYVIAYREKYHHLPTENQLKRLASALRVPEAEVKNVLDEGNLGDLIDTQQDSQFHIVVDRLVSTISKKRFIKEILSIAMQRLDQDFDRKDALFSAETLSIPERSLPQYIQEYKKLVRRFANEPVSVGDPITLLQCLGVVLPLTSIPGSSSERVHQSID